MRFFYSARRRAGHRNDFSKRSDSSVKRCKQGEYHVCDVRGETDIIEKINTHKYRRRLKGICREHRFLYVNLRISFEKNSNDKELISNIIAEIFKCEGNLQSIFSVLLPGHVIRNMCHTNNNMHMLYPGLKAKFRRKGIVEAFEFYLRNICQSSELGIQPSSDGFILNREFDVGQSFTPLLAATMRRDPELVLLLLRYGADPLHCAQGSDIASCCDPIENLIEGLNSITMFKNSEFSQETKEALSDEENRGMLCLEYFYRSTSHIYMAESREFRPQEHDEDKESLDPTASGKVYYLHPTLASCMDMTLLSGPRSLQHLSRCVIRRSLQERCAFTSILPDLIFSLPLPKHIKSYLDLMMSD